MLRCNADSWEHCQVSDSNSTSRPDAAAVVDQNLARNVREARERRGWSQSELARQATEAGLRGFHQTTIARVESGQRPLRAAEAIVLSWCLGSSFESLAESTEVRALNMTLQRLSDASRQFYEAASNLISARFDAAMWLDSRFDLDLESGFARSEEVIRAGLDPDFTERLEALIGKTDLGEAVYSLAEDVVRRVSPSPDEPRRAFVLRELAALVASLEQSEVADGEH